PVFVAGIHGTSTVLGFYTLSAHAVELTALPEQLRKRLAAYGVVPAFILGRLAVASAYGGQGIGTLLVLNALQRCCNNDIAAALIIVDAEDEAVVGFYQKFGF